MAAIPGSSTDAAVPDRTAALLVFDFDGVLCDSLEECMMVAWYAHTRAEAICFVDPGLAGVPADVIDRFRRCRPFMRHLAHFLVPLVVETGLPTTHADFAARYEALPSADVERFAADADAYRARIRREHAEAWHARHTVESGLRELAAGAYIATARDSASVGHILSAHGFEVDPDRVFGSLRGKVPALRRIALRESRSPAEVVLVDDSIENCIAARQVGFAAYWAEWGYHADDDAETARRYGIAGVSVDGLLQVRRHTPARS